MPFSSSTSTAFTTVQGVVFDLRKDLRVLMGLARHAVSSPLGLSEIPTPVPPELAPSDVYYTEPAASACCARVHLVSTG
jgi:hypothetical protein